MDESRSSGSKANGGWSDGLTWVASILVAVFAGGNPVAFQVSNWALPPFRGAALPFTGAAVIF